MVRKPVGTRFGICCGVLVTFLVLPLAGAVFSGTALDSTANAGAYQATACCWLGTNTEYCFKPKACSDGDEVCESDSFQEWNGYGSGYAICAEMSTRGEAVDGLVADPAPRLFVASRGGDLSAEEVALLRTLTAVSRLEHLAVKDTQLAEKKYADPRGALDELGISLPAEMSISIVRDKESGEDIVTVEGSGKSETLRYAADGSIIPAEAEASE